MHFFVDLDVDPLFQKIEIWIKIINNYDNYDVKLQFYYLHLKNQYLLPKLAFLSIFVKNDIFYYGSRSSKSMQIRILGSVF